MKLTILTRLIIGYLAIFLLAMAVSLYAIYQLRNLEEVTQSIVTVDNRLVNYEKKLSDFLFLMIGYEKKFVIIKDKPLYEHFTMLEADFDGIIEEINTIDDTARMASVLNKISSSFHMYHSLFNEEAEHIISGRTYSVDDYKIKKEDAVNNILDGLKQLRGYSQRNTYDKVKSLGEADIKASRIAILIGTVSLVLGVIISISITLNITRPLSVIKKKTGLIAAGNFDSDLELSSPPEIAELANSFNIMCVKLKALDKLKSDFFALMSHELRTPLTTIKEAISLIREDMTEGETAMQKKLLYIVNEETVRLINLVSSLLDFSKIEAGMMVYNFNNADIVELIKKVVREMGPLVESKDINLEVKIRDEQAFVSIDTEKMLQVLRNLIVNAIKFTPDGGSVTVLSERVDNELKVSVSDTGKGIAPDKLTLIFNKYQQVDHAGTGRSKGSGLGLYIVKQIIVAHGGVVWAESTPGSGSTFAFVLPA